MNNTLINWSTLLEFITALVSLTESYFSYKESKKSTSGTYSNASQANFSNFNASEISGSVSINQVNNINNDHSDLPKKLSQQKTISLIGIFALVFFCYIFSYKDATPHVVSFSVFNSALLLFVRCITLYLCCLLPAFILRRRPLQRYLNVDSAPVKLARKISGILWVLTPLVMFYLYFFNSAFPTNNFFVLALAAYSSYKMFTLFVPIVNIGLVYYIDNKSHNLFNHILAWGPIYAFLFFF